MMEKMTAATVMMVAEGTAMTVVEVMAKTEKAAMVMMEKVAADGNDGEGGGRWHIGGDTGP
jgi:hypothetical protein